MLKRNASSRVKNRRIQTSAWPFSDRSYAGKFPFSFAFIRALNISCTCSVSKVISFQTVPTFFGTPCTVFALCISGKSNLVALSRASRRAVQGNPVANSILLFFLKGLSCKYRHYRHWFSLKGKLVAFDVFENRSSTSFVENRLSVGLNVVYTFNRE